jgi:hypothetical protein
VLRAVQVLNAVLCSYAQPTFPPVDGFCVGGHAVEEVGDELGMTAVASGEAELPEFCGGTVVVVDRLIRGIGVDLAGAVAVDLYPDTAEKFSQLRFVVDAHAFARGAPLGLGGHDRDGTVFPPGRPSARGSPADTRAAPRSTCCSVPAAMRAYSRRGQVTQREPKRSASADRDHRLRAVDSGR